MGELELADLSASHRVPNSPRDFGVGLVWGWHGFLRFVFPVFRSSILIFDLLFPSSSPLSTTTRLSHLPNMPSRQGTPINLRSGSSTQPVDFNPKAAG